MGMFEKVLVMLVGLKSWENIIKAFLGIWLSLDPKYSFYHKLKRKYIILIIYFKSAYL